MAAHSYIRESKITDNTELVDQATGTTFAERRKMLDVVVEENIKHYEANKQQYLNLDELESQARLNKIKGDINASGIQEISET